jgi:hypothetical protein
MKKLVKELENKKLSWDIIHDMTVDELIQIDMSLENERDDLYKQKMELDKLIDPIQRRIFRSLDEKQSVNQAIWLKFVRTNDIKGLEERGDLNISKEERKKAKEYYYKKPHHEPVNKEE